MTSYFYNVALQVSVKKVLLLIEFLVGITLNFFPNTLYIIFSNFVKLGALYRLKIKSDYMTTKALPFFFQNIKTSFFFQKIHCGNLGKFLLIFEN